MTSEPAPVRRGRKKLPAFDLSEPVRIRRRPLHDEILNELRSMIVRGDLAPGARVAEASLCEALGVSRTPLREALKLLAAEGLVKLQPNRGARIARLDAGEVVDLFEAASGIEAFAASLAATRMDLAAFEQLSRMQSAMEAAADRGSRAEYSRLNARIHSAIVSGAGNPTLTTLHSDLLGRIERARRVALNDPDRVLESIVEHRAVLEALGAGDGARAGELLGRHVRRTGEVVESMLIAVGESG